MTEIAYVEGGVVTRFPINLRTEFPNTSFPATISKSSLPDGYYPVISEINFSLPEIPGIIGNRPYKRRVAKPHSEWTVNESNVTKTYDTAYDDVEVYRQTITAKIDREAEQERLNYITDGAGQSMTYQEKEKEANRYLIDPDPQPEDYPFLKREVGITAPTLAAVVDSVIEMRSLWAVVGPLIEEVRLGSKKAVNDASGETDPEILEAIYQAYSSISWPNPSAA